MTLYLNMGAFKRADDGTSPILRLMQLGETCCHALGILDTP
jgi:hypothetical protein